ncbi:MAG: CHAD domain-containing protein, partial [Sandaracinus sp.]|nr:CHAD domain-containing protein [Sandaracinus sp.]
MTLPDDLLTRSADEATRRVALGLLDQAERACERVRSRGDDDALHDFRVAVRRLRSLARAHRRHLGDVLGGKRRRRLRAIQHATGGARDAEVALAWTRKLVHEIDESMRGALEAFERSLAEVPRDDAGAHAATEKLEKLAQKIREPLATTTVRLEGDEPETYGAVLGGLARTHVADLAEQLTRVTDRHEDEAIHDARIAGKRLRYLLEPVREAVPGVREIVTSLKRLQDVLGDVHDLHVLALAIDEAAEHVDDESSNEELAALAALRERAMVHADASFADFLAAFGGLRRAELVDRVETLARRLDGARQTETERKYLLRRLPEGARRHPAKELWQGYLPGVKVRERLRREELGEEIRFVRTIKAGRGVQRVEIEETTTREVFDFLWPLTEGARVLKRRYTIEDGGLVWEIDEFLDRDLVLAEVELP